MATPHPHHGRLPLYLTGIGVLVLLLVASGLYVSLHKSPVADETLVQVTPSASATAPGNVAAVTQSSPSPSGSLGTTAIPTAPNKDGTITIPETARAFLANFYAAYSTRDRDRLGTLFTADPDDSLKYLHAVLFTGKDTQGNPASGGPTLFISNNVLEFTTQYTILGATPQDKNWVITVSENRQSPSGSQRNLTTLLTLLPSTTGQNSWLIDGYIPAGGNGKYSGFFIQ